MWNNLAKRVREFLFGVPDPQPEVVPDYNLPEEWPFTGPKPSNELVHTLNNGFETVGDHIMYRSQETGRTAGVIYLGDDSWLTKELTYWIAGGTLNPGQKYGNIRATCGSQRCVRPDHLTPKYLPSKKQKDPAKKDKPKLEVNKVQGPPEYKPPAKPKLTGKTKTELLAGDRTICPSAKVFYDTLVEAQAVAAYFNNHFRDSGQQRLYGYDCDWCAGNHLTHHNPKKHNFKHKGSW